MDRKYPELLTSLPVSTMSRRPGASVLSPFGRAPRVRRAPLRSAYRGAPNFHSSGLPVQQPTVALSTSLWRWRPNRDHGRRGASRLWGSSVLARRNAPGVRTGAANQLATATWPVKRAEPSSPAKTRCSLRQVRGILAAASPRGGRESYSRIVSIALPYSERRTSPITASARRTSPTPTCRLASHARAVCTGRGSCPGIYAGLDAQSGRRRRGIDSRAHPRLTWFTNASWRSCESSTQAFRELSVAVPGRLLPDERISALSPSRRGARVNVLGRDLRFPEICASTGSAAGAIALFGEKYGDRVRGFSSATVAPSCAVARRANSGSSAWSAVW